MDGRPIEQVEGRGRSAALRHMRPDDTFNIVRFSMAREQLVKPRPVPATQTNVEQRAAYIRV